MTTTTLTIPQKFQALENATAGVVLERTREIHTAMVALVAEMHHLQVGEPGIAKTYMVDTFSRFIFGARGFRWLLTRFTQPPEIFGPPSLKALEQDIYRVNTANKLPEADFAFLDEFFKCNSAMLNAFLTLMNEGLFFNNGTPIKVPLSTIFCGSNELPREPELAALWDRVTIRHEVHRIRERGNRRQMLQLRLAKRLNGAGPVDPIISWDEVKTAQADAAKVVIPNDVLDAFDTLIDNLFREGIEPTDRRIADCVPIIQANAYLAGNAVADIDDMRVLRHVLWMDLAQQPVVDRLVLELANPLDKEAMVLLDEIDKLSAQVTDLIRNTDATEVKVRQRKGLEINGKAKRCGDELELLLDKAKNSPRRSEMVEEAKTRLQGLIQTLLEELFDK